VQTVETGSRPLVKVLWTFLMTAAAGILTLGSMVADGEAVGTRAQQDQLSFGWPLAWVTQDQSSLDPPLPYRLSVASPLESPTHFHELALVVDFALMLGVVLAAAWLIRRAAAEKSAHAADVREG
jgi:hypothetical protein